MEILTFSTIRYPDFHTFDKILLNRKELSSLKKDLGPIPRKSGRISLLFEAA
jgi:hypothetical protein